MEEHWCEETHGPDFIHAIQAVFNRTSPFAERYSNWLRSDDEPWRSLAGLFESP